MSLDDSASNPPSPQTSIRAFGFAILAGIALIYTGCGLASNLMHGLGMDMIPAEYDDFEDTTLAIVTVTDSSQYSNDVAARDLNRRVGEVLTQKINDVELIRQDQIDHWRDVKGWDATNFVEIGKGVGAQKVLGIELTDLKLRDGPTLYRGSCEARVKVIDVETGNVEYTRSIDEFLYPNLAGQDATGITETRFRKLYLGMLAQEIARSFHPYDMTDRFAIDSKIAHF